MFLTMRVTRLLKKKRGTMLADHDDGSQARKSRQHDLPICFGLDHEDVASAFAAVYFLIFVMS